MATTRSFLHLFSCLSYLAMAVVMYTLLVHANHYAQPDWNTMTLVMLSPTPWWGRERRDPSVCKKALANDMPRLRETSGLLTISHRRSDLTRLVIS